MTDIFLGRHGFSLRSFPTTNSISTFLFQPDFVASTYTIQNLIKLQNDILVELLFSESTVQKETLEFSHIHGSVIKWIRQYRKVIKSWHYFRSLFFRTLLPLNSSCNMCILSEHRWPLIFGIFVTNNFLIACLSYENIVFSDIQISSWFVSPNREISFVWTLKLFDWCRGINAQGCRKLCVSSN